LLPALFCNSRQAEKKTEEEELLKKEESNKNEGALIPCVLFLLFSKRYYYLVKRTQGRVRQGQKGQDKARGAGRQSLICKELLYIAYSPFLQKQKKKMKMSMALWIENWWSGSAGGS
jgi:hypothetical protein